jgi:hypothetical protein
MISFFFSFMLTLLVLFIKDLTAINEGNPDYWNDEKTFINIDKVEVLGTSDDKWIVWF